MSEPIDALSTNPAQPLWLAPLLAQCASGGDPWPKVLDAGRRSGKANVMASLLRCGTDELQRAGIDPDAVVQWLPLIAYPVVAGLSDLPQRFAAASVAAQAKMVEILVRTGHMDLIRRLAEERVADPRTQAALLLYSAVVQAFVDFDYRAGQQWARRCRFGGERSAVDAEVLRWVAFEFVDVAGALALMGEAGYSIDGALRVQVEARVRALRATPFTPTAAALQGAGSDLVQLLGWLDTGAGCLLPAARSALATESDHMTDWHTQRAMLSFVRSSLVLGHGDDLEAFLRVASDMVLTGRERAAVALFLSTRLKPAQLLRFDQFKCVQKLVLASDSEAQMRAVATHAVATLGPGLSAGMASVLQASAAGGVPAAEPPDAATRRAQLRTLALQAEQLNAPRGARRPRVAICLAGQLRSFGRNWPAILASVVEPLGADVFVSTWDKVGFATGFQQDAGRLMPPQIAALLPADCRTTPGLFARFPRLAQALSDNADSSQPLLRKVPELAAWRVHDEAVFDAYLQAHYGPAVLESRFARNHVKMFFTMWDAYHLAQQHAASHGHSYDLIVRMRPDMEVSDFCADALLHAPPAMNTVYVNHYHRQGVSDQFAFGPAPAMQAYLTAFELIDAARGFELFPMGYGSGGESTLFDLLAHRGLRCELKNVISYELSSKLMSVAASAELMLADLAKWPTPEPALRGQLELLRTQSAD